jgi:hypothetical protein
LDANSAKVLDAEARAFTRYVLFADEVPLPAGGIVGDSAYKADFLKPAASSRARHCATSICATGSSVFDAVT